MPRKLKIFFHMIDAVGPQNACIGLGQVLLQRGHEVYFLTRTNNARQGKFSDYGFKTFPLKASDKDTGEISEEQAIVEQKQEMEAYRKMGVFDNIEPMQKLKQMMDDAFVVAYMGIQESYEKQIRVLIDQEKPDLIVVDSIGITPPSLVHSGIPWVYIYCSNPIGVFHSLELPPPNTGLPVNGSRDQWPELQQITNDIDDTLAKHNEQFLRKFNYPVPENPTPGILSPYLNIYQFPKEIDYDDVISIPENYIRVDTLCREEKDDFTLPDELKSKMKPGDKLIYFSLGSIGTSDVKLMKRIIAILAKTPYFYIVSKGLFHDQIELPENMWGGRYVPQTKILPIVDMAIIHGGNNSLTEAFLFGTPFIVLPIFFDQYDNAQRVQEKNYGIRLDPHTFKDEELLNAIDKVLNDAELKAKFVKASKRIQSSDSKVKACIAMEKVVEQFGKN